MDEVHVRKKQHNAKGYRETEAWRWRIQTQKTERMRKVTEGWRENRRRGRRKGEERRWMK